MSRLPTVLWWLAGLLLALPAAALELPQVIDRVRPSVVAVGTVQPSRRPPANFQGSGFVVGDGRHVVTNAHVVPERLNEARNEYLAVFVGRGRQFQSRRASVVVWDQVHDLALLKMEGSPLPALDLGDSERVREGESVAFTGFPLGVVLGLFPATHRGIIAAITPVAFPVPAAGQLDPALIRALRDPYDIFQLDATAYPGNSGSPLYEAGTGRVIGVINKVFVKSTKEAVIQDPSGITYAVPARYVRDLLRQAGVPQR